MIDLSKRRWIVLSLIFLSSCSLLDQTDRLGPQFEFKEIRFQDLEPNSFFWENMEAGALENKTVRLELWGMYSLTESTIFIFGQLDGIGHGRSIMLKTTDAGNSWFEVMIPQWGNSIIDMQVLPDGRGWAMSQWVIEGPGKMTLYRTEDFGDTWVQLNELPSVYFGFYHGIRFFDESNGQLQIESNSAGPNDKLIVFQTDDGGDSWDIVVEIPKFSEFDSETGEGSVNYTYLDMEDIFEDASGWLSNPNCVWFPLDCKISNVDGSIWKIERIDFKSGYSLRMKNLESKGWDIELILPSQFVYSDGKITIMELIEEK